MKSNTTLALVGVALAAAGAYMLLNKPKTVLGAMSVVQQLQQMGAGAEAISFASTLANAPNRAGLDGAWAGVKIAAASGSFGPGVYDLLRQLYLARGGTNP